MNVILQVPSGQGRAKTPSTEVVAAFSLESPNIARSRRKIDALCTLSPEPNLPFLTALACSPHLVTDYDVLAACFRQRELGGLA